MIFIKVRVNTSLLVSPKFLSGFWPISAACNLNGFNISSDFELHQFLFYVLWNYFEGFISDLCQYHLHVLQIFQFLWKAEVFLQFFGFPLLSVCDQLELGSSFNFLTKIRSGLLVGIGESVFYFKIPNILCLIL